jgi:hypothetical protein
MSSSFHDPIGYLLGWIVTALFVVGIGVPVAGTIVAMLFPTLFWALLGAVSISLGLWLANRN